MRPFPEALAAVNKGWSPRTDVMDRGVLMRDHALHGNWQRAEEYAVEIEKLVRADNERIGIEDYRADWPVGLDIIDWSGRIMSGGWRVSRRAHPDTLPQIMAIAAE